MEWVKKHADTVIVLGGILSSMIWVNGKFEKIDERFSYIEKDLAVMKAVMVMQKIMPAELVAKGEK